MKILHIITRLIQGGAQINTLKTCEAQVAQGHEVHLAFGPIAGPEGTLLPAAQEAGAVTHEVPHMVRAVRPWSDRACGRELRNLIDQLGPDVVHTHSSKAGILGRAAAWQARVPLVIHTIHGLPFHDGNSVWTNCAYIAAEKRAARQCHKLIGITHAMIRAFKDHRIGRPEQYEVVPSGIDTAAFEVSDAERAEARAAVRQELGLPAEAPVIGIVARLDPFKGHDDLINVLPRLRERHPDLHVLFVGDGFHARKLKTRIAFSCLSGAVTFTGMVPQAEVRRLMAAMDIMALPSYQEGQGRTLAEALLCGSSIVGYAVGGIPEVCIAAKTGLLVKPGQWWPFYEALNWLLEHPRERRALVEAGQKHVRENLDIRQMVAKLDSIYNRHDAAATSQAPA